jgi:hypothetical protein
MRFWRSSGPINNWEQPWPGDVPLALMMDLLDQLFIKEPADSFTDFIVHVTP